MPRRNERNDKIGQRFGRLVVMGYAGKSNHRHSRWACLCDCGGKGITTNKLFAPVRVETASEKVEVAV